MSPYLYCGRATWGENARMLLMLLQEFTHTSPVLAFTSRDFDHDSQSFLETIHIKPKPNSNQVIILVPIYVPAARRTVPAIDTRFERSLGHDQRVPTFAEQLFLTLMAQHDVPGSRDNKNAEALHLFTHQFKTTVLSLQSA